MLADTDAIATIAVKRSHGRKKIYEGTLGMKPKPSQQETEALEYKSGDSKVFVYRSQYAGTNKASAATWVVDDMDEVVRTLKGKGVTFEHYDLPGLTLKGDVHVAGRMKAAWFKDPDGNTDGPFTETKELIAGFAIVQAKSKAEAIELAKQFLKVVGEGESEVRLMHDQPAFEAEPTLQFSREGERQRAKPTARG